MVRLKRMIAVHEGARWTKRSHCENYSNYGNNNNNNNNNNTTTTMSTLVAMAHNEERIEQLNGTTNNGTEQRTKTTSNLRSRQ